MTMSKREVFAQLNNLGLKERQIRPYLPSWMTNEALETKSGLAHLKVLLVRRFGIDPEPLFSNDKVLFRRPASIRFKRTANLAQDTITPAAAIAVSVISHSLRSFKYPYQPLPAALDLRKRILSDAKYVSLNALLHYATHTGIPVLPIRKLPRNLAKMDGISAMPNEVPAIGISRHSQFSAWYSFILAHELGHIYHKHVCSGHLLIDESFDEESFSSDKEDQDERAADTYAFALLSGNIDPRRLDLSDFQTPGDIAEAALLLQRKFKIDAGHIILRNAYAGGEWRLYTSALQRLENQPGRADMILNQGLIHGIDTKRLPKESVEFLEMVCAVELPTDDPK